MPDTVARLKSLFFDRAAVRAATTRAKNKSLSRFGAFVRQRAKSSLKYRKAPSAAGAPPSVHRHGDFTREKTNKKTGQVTRRAVSQFKELIYFAYVPAVESVIIGPALLNGTKNLKPTVPELHEEGGERRVHEVEISPGVWFRSSPELNKHLPHRDRTARYPARPFMKPAYLAELPRAAALFKGMIR